MRFIRLHTLAFEDILVFGTGPAEIFAEEVSFFIQRFCKLQPDAFACFSFQAERYPSGDVLSEVYNRFVSGGDDFPYRPYGLGYAHGLGFGSYQDVLVNFLFEHAFPVGVCVAGFIPSCEFETGIVYFAMIKVGL